MPDKTKFSEKSVLVTGGASGIGQMAAVNYAGAGARVYVLDRDISEYEHLTYISGDVSNLADCQNAIDRVVTETGKIDILINAAANKPEKLSSEISDLSISDLQNALNVHLIGAYNTCIAAWPYMQKHQFGRIINFSSGHIFGSLGDHDLIPFTIAKSAIIGLTRALATPGLSDGILVNTLFPAALDTSWNRIGWRTPTQQEEIALAEICNSESLWPIISFLTSDNSLNVTGEMFSQCNGNTTRVILGDGPNTEYSDSEPFEEFMSKVRKSEVAYLPRNIGHFFSMHLGAKHSRVLGKMLRDLRDNGPDETQVNQPTQYRNVS